MSIALRWPLAQIALPFILMVSGIIIEITIAGSFVAYFLSTSGFGERLAFRAGAAAHAGLEDTVIRIARDKEYAASGASSNLSLDGDSASVSVSRTVNNTANIYVYTITITGTAGSRQKKLIATMVVNQTTGQVQLQSVAEAPVS